MNPGIRCVGIQEALAGIQEGFKKIQGVSREGIIAAALFTEGECTRTITDVLYSLPEPADKPRPRTGNLRASRFTIWGNSPSPASPTFKALSNEDSVEESYAVAVEEGMSFVNGSTPERFMALVGYGAFYAIFVHEGVTGKFDGFRWIESTLQSKRQEIIDKVAERVRTAT